MTEDEKSEIEHIEYNHLNLPTRVAMAQGEIYYVYDASGVKLEKQVRDGKNPQYLLNTQGIISMKMMNYNSLIMRRGILYLILVEKNPIHFVMCINTKIT